MPSATDSWGIEVGANAIKAVHLQKTGDEVKVVDYDILPFKKILTTPDLDVDEAIRLGLEQFNQKHIIGNASVCVSVPGHMVFSRFAKLPPVEPKKIPQIVKFEAVQQIPFPIDDVEWDYQVFQRDDLPDVDVGIFAITKERIAPWLSNFEAVGMPVHAVSLSPIAAFNAMTWDLNLIENGETTVIMDVGTSATDLIIADAGCLWMRTIPIGGNHFTEALVKGFKLSFSKAEKLKREAPTSKYARQIFQAMRPTFVDLAQEVQKSLGYYQSINRDAEIKRIIGLGSTFRMSGLRTFLKQQLQISVDRIDSFKRADCEETRKEDFEENSVVLTTAYGLAAQGLELETISCNLLPKRLIRSQLWNAKKPWLVSSSGVMVLAAIIALAMFFYSKHNYNQVKTEVTQFKSTINKAKKNNKTWTDTLKNRDPRGNINQFNTILKHRNLTPQVMADVDAGLQAIYADKPEYLKQYVIAETDEEIKKAAEEKLNLAKDIQSKAISEHTVVFVDKYNIEYGTVRIGKGKEAVVKPKMTITLNGHTPLKDSDKLISVTFMSAIKASIEKNPYYSIIEGSDNVVTEAMVAEEAKKTRSTGTPTGDTVQAKPIAQPLIDFKGQSVTKFTITWEVTVEPQAK